MFPYLQWLDTYVVERKTKSNYKTVESVETVESEDDSDNGVRENVGMDKSATDGEESNTESSTSNSSQTWKFHKGSGKYSKKKLDRDEAELNLIKSLRENFRHKEENVKVKDDNDIFGELVASQLKLLPPEKNVVVKMQISNLMYGNMLPSASNVNMGHVDPSHYSHSPIMIQDQGNAYFPLG